MIVQSQRASSHSAIATQPQRIERARQPTHPPPTHQPTQSHTILTTYSTPPLLGFRALTTPSPRNSNNNPPLRTVYVPHVPTIHRSVTLPQRTPNAPYRNKHNDSIVPSLHPLRLCKHNLARHHIYIHIYPTTTAAITTAFVPALPPDTHSIHAPLQALLLAAPAHAAQPRRTRTSAAGGKGGWTTLRVG